MHFPKRRKLRVLLGTSILLLALSCGGFSPDESFFWGPGGAANLTPDEWIQVLIDAGGGWAGNRWNVNHMVVVVIDALTRNPIDGAEVVIGNGGNYFQTFTAGDGRVTVDFNTLSGVPSDVISAGGPGYETTTVQHGGVYIYVIPLRPNVLGAYTEVGGTVSNLSSSDHRKFEASLSTAVRAIDDEGTRLRREGFGVNGTYRFLCEPDRAGDLTILELDAGDPSNFVSEMTAGLAAGNLDNRAPALPGSPPSVIPVSGGVQFGFDRGTEHFSTYDTTTARGRIIAFRAEHFSPQVLGSRPIDTSGDQFFMYTVDTGGFENYRAQLHLDSVSEDGGKTQGTCDVFWDLPDLNNASPQFVNIPGLPFIQNPQVGSKNLGPGPNFNWNNWGGSNEGFYELEIRDRLKSFPESLVWRYWTPVDNFGTGGSYGVGSIDFPTSFGLKNLEFEKDYAWRLVRYRVPSQDQPADPLYYGNIYREAQFINRTEWMSFVIDIAGEGPSQFISDTLDALQAQGGGVRGSRMNINNVWVRVFDEVTGTPLDTAQVKIGQWTLDQRATNSSGELFYDPWTTSGDDGWVITACMAGYENTTFWGFNGHIVAIPMRPNVAAGYARISGSANNFGPNATWKGAVSALHGYEGSMREIVNEGDPYTFHVRANEMIHFTAMIHDGGSMTNFEHVSMGPYGPGASVGHSTTFAGASPFPIVSMENGGQGSLQGLSSITSGHAYVRGMGLNRAKPWRSVLVGLGDTNTSSMWYTLDAVRLPGVEEMKTDLRYTGWDTGGPINGSIEVTLPVTDLSRALPPVNIPLFPDLNSPPNGAINESINPWFNYWPSSGGNDKTGMSVLYIHEAATNFPSHLKWRIFTWPWDSGTGFTLPPLNAPFDLASATTYEWFVRQYFGKYDLTMSDASGGPVNFGKWSMALMDMYRDYLTESVHWTFTTS